MTRIASAILKRVKARNPTPVEAQLAYMLQKVDIRPIKDVVRKHFLVGSKLRMVVEAEPDFLPRHEMISKILPWDLLLRSELRDR